MIRFFRDSLTWWAQSRAQFNVSRLQNACLETFKYSGQRNLTANITVPKTVPVPKRQATDFFDSVLLEAPTLPEGKQDGVLK
jgi:hypothetical protein